ncbi:hypothetical protein GXW71_14190 [Roseomonas hellenica]|uniref:Transmembrane protein n=1 Tax=Plastoroseomonas hellenica TaxID=2687306 RepID=A0ABS5EYX3_9PROT|nr:hypothetical protein [Plastoroseomonas hellenica]MBR0665508.1 hypothetical protein [Plastoroseomonas hellenica]
MSGRAAGLAPLIGATAGLIVWALHFGAIYLANAIACGRGLAGHRLFGQPIIPVLILAATALALLLLLGIGMRARRRPRVRDGAGVRHFLARLTLATTLLAALAVTWEGAAVLLVGPCG